MFFLYLPSKCIFFVPLENVSFLPPYKIYVCRTSPLGVHVEGGGHYGFCSEGCGPNHAEINKGIRLLPMKNCHILYILLFLGWTDQKPSARTLFSKTLSNLCWIIPTEDRQTYKSLEDWTQVADNVVTPAYSTDRHYIYVEPSQRSQLWKCNHNSHNVENTITIAEMITLLEDLPTFTQLWQNVLEEMCKLLALPFPDSTSWPDLVFPYILD